MTGNDRYIFFGYYKFVARPMVGGFGVSLGVVLSR